MEIRLSRVTIQNSYRKKDDEVRLRQEYVSYSSPGLWISLRPVELHIPVTFNLVRVTQNVDTIPLRKIILGGWKVTQLGSNSLREADDKTHKPFYRMQAGQFKVGISPFVFKCRCKAGELRTTSSRQTGFRLV